MGCHHDYQIFLIRVKQPEHSPHAVIGERLMIDGPSSLQYQQMCCMASEAETACSAQAAAEAGKTGPYSFDCSWMHIAQNVDAFPRDDSACTDVALYSSCLSSL